LQRQFECKLVSKRHYRLEHSNGRQSPTISVSKKELRALSETWGAGGGEDQVSQAFSRGTLRTISSGIAEMIETGSAQWSL